MTTKMSPPWLSFFRKIEVLFKDDPEITLRYIDEDPKTVKLYVNNVEKADALSKILPTEKNISGISVRIMVIPANVEARESGAELFKTAFAGNPAFEYVISIGEMYSNPVNYCVFKKEVVQYWNDNLGDPHGIESTLYQDIARDVFDDRYGMIFCTESQ